MLPHLAGRYAEPGQEAEYERRGMLDAVAHVLSTLRPREAETLRLRFGLDDVGDGLTLREIGEIYERTPENVRQWEARSLRKLRHPSRANRLRCFHDADPDSHLRADRVRFQREREDAEKTKADARRAHFKAWWVYDVSRRCFRHRKDVGLPLPGEFGYDNPLDSPYAPV